MEQIVQEISELKHQSRFMSKTLGRFIACCLSIITFCVTTIVGFVWTMKGDFAAEQEKTKSLIESVNAVKSGQEKTTGQVQTLREEFKEHSARTDERIGIMERTILAYPLRTNK